MKGSIKRWRKGDILPQWKEVKSQKKYVGVGVRGGCEALIHAVRTLIDSNDENLMLCKWIP